MFSEVVTVLLEHGVFRNGLITEVFLVGDNFFSSG